MIIREIRALANMDGFGLPCPISGVLFGGEDQAHKFIISRQDGQAITGTVAVKFLRYADDVTVPLIGSIEDGAATVTLNESCYLRPGRFKLTLYVTESGSTTAVYCCMGTVDRTDGQRTVDPGSEITLDVTDLINQIDEAVDSIPPTWTELSGEVDELKSAFINTLDKQPTRNLFDPYTMTDNLLIDGSGVETTNANYITSDFILITNVNAVISSTGAVDREYQYRVAVYDANKTWMRRVLGTQNTLVLDGVNNCYIRICFEKARQTDFNTVQAELGSTATEYVPHQMPYDYNGRTLISNLQKDIDETANYSDEFGNVVFNDGYYAAYMSSIDDVAYTENGTLSYSDPIPVVPESAIRLQNVWKAGYAYCIWLDFDKKYIGKAEANTTGSETSSVRVDAPLNAYYAIVNVLTEHKTAFIISYYNDLTNFNKTENIEKSMYSFNHIGNSFAEIINNGPMFSLCDDDTTSLELVRIYHDICADLGANGCYATITFRLDDDPNLASALLGYEEEGFGIYYHCMRQISAYNPLNFDEATAQVNFVQGLRKFKEYGFLNDNIWLVPYGGATNAIISMARRHGIRYIVDGELNNRPYAHHVTDKFFNYPSKYLNHYNVMRIELTPYDTQAHTMAKVKAAIDECVEKKGWIIITTHVNEWYQKDADNIYDRDEHGNLIPIVTDGETGESRLREVIEYCQSQGLSNKTIAQGLSLYDPVYNWSESI